MNVADLKSYKFKNASQWRACLTDQFEIGPDDITSSGSLDINPLIGCETEQGISAFAFDSCGSFYWIRENTFELLELYRGSAVSLGLLNTVGFTSKKSEVRVVQLFVGLRQIWILTENKQQKQQLFIYARSDLQLLDEVDLKRNVLALCQDHREGIWLLYGGDGSDAEIVHINGHSERNTKQKLNFEISEASVIFDRESERLFILDYSSSNNEFCRDWLWSLYAFDPCAKPDKKVITLFSQPSRSLCDDCDEPAFVPTNIAIDCDQRLALFSATTGRLWLISVNGELIAKYAQTIDAKYLPATGFLSHSNAFFIASQRGIFNVQLLQSINGPIEHRPTIITPVLISPDGKPNGWLRADLLVDLPENVAIEISVASASSREKVVRDAAAIFANDQTPEPKRIVQLNALLPWQEANTQIYRGGTCLEKTLRFPLHSFEENRLWLRIRVLNSDGLSVPKIKQLTVYYPNISLLNNLPAFIQQDQTTLPFLRGILAVFESVHGDFAQYLDELPANIDPLTAPDNWLPFLIHWLGLPIATELTLSQQRQLLDQAPELLQLRGTRKALEKLLAIVVASQFKIIDYSSANSPWVLPAKAKDGTFEETSSFSSRLGCETLVTRPEQPKSFRLGTQAIVGEQALGTERYNAMEVFNRRSGKIDIFIDPGRQSTAALEKFLHRYFRIFIPVHCRYNLKFVTSQQLVGVPRLNESLQLQSPLQTTLAENSKLGKMRLRADARAFKFSGRGITLSTNTILDTHLVL